MGAAVGVRDEWDEHVLLLCRDEAHRRSSVSTWMRRGLDRGEKVLWTDVPGDAALMSSLARDGMGLAAAIEVGQLRLLPVDEFYSLGPALLVRDALAEGYPGVRLAARAEAAIDHLGQAGYQRVERQVDELCATLPVTELCQYGLSASQTELFDTVVDAHPDAVRDAEMRLLRRDGRLSVGGEVDFGSARALTRALRRACQLHDGPRLELELAELDFIDVAGCRAICVGTESYRRGGGAVCLRGAQPHVHRVLTLLGMDRLDGVDVR